MVILITALMKIITTITRYQNVTSLTITSESMATIRIAVIVTMFRIKREKMFLRQAYVMILTIQGRKGVCENAEKRKIGRKKIKIILN